MRYSRPLDDIRVGGEIDAACTRCKMTTNHRIVAMVEGVVKRVICLTCQSQHNFRRPAEEKKSEKQQVMKIPKSQKKVTSASGTKIYALWLEKKNNLDAEPIAYNFEQTYQVGSVIDHKKFGLGFVQKVIVPNKMEVMFETEIKTLAMAMN